VIRLKRASLDALHQAFRKQEPLCLLTRTLRRDFHGDSLVSSCSRAPTSGASAPSRSRHVRDRLRAAAISQPP
jgi:hypothetical protein